MDRALTAWYEYSQSGGSPEEIARNPMEKARALFASEEVSKEHALRAATRAVTVASRYRWASLLQLAVGR